MARPERALFAGLLVFALLRVTTCANVGRAQSDDREALALLRICAHEESRLGLADCDGIYSVLRHVADRHELSLVAALRLTSPRFFAGIEPRNRWVHDLTLECDRPAGYRGVWPEAQCRALAAHVRELVQGPAVCAATVWGSERDHARRRAQGCTWEPVDCGETRNRFSRAMRCP